MRYRVSNAKPKQNVREFYTEGRPATKSGKVIGLKLMDKRTRWRTLMTEAGVPAQWWP